MHETSEICGSVQYNTLVKVNEATQVKMSQPFPNSKTIDDLPDDVLARILSYLPLEYVVHVVSRVCTRWQGLSGDFSIWKGRVYIVKATGLTQEDSEVARALQHCPGVRHVEMQRPVKPSVLKALGYYGMVKTLIFDPKQQLSTDVLSQLLEQCPSITKLCLPPDVLKRPDCMKLISSLGSLEYLMVKAKKRAGLNLDLLSDCPNLRSINAMEAVCASETLSNFLTKKGSQLKELALLGMTSDGGSVLPHLGPCHKTLKKLCISMDEAKGKDFMTTLPLLGKFEALVELQLIEIPWQGAVLLAEAFSDSGLRHLRSVTFINVNALKGMALAALIRDRQELQHLDISRCRKVKDKDLIAGLSATEPNPLPLLSINLSFCDSLSNVSVNEVAHRCPKLQKLHLSACLDVQEYALQPISRLADLQVLDISRCYHLKEWWKPLLDLHQLRWLDVSYLPIVPAYMEQLINQNKYLYYLGLEFCNGFDEATCKRWLKTYPHLRLKFDEGYIKCQQEGVP